MKEKKKKREKQEKITREVKKLEIQEDTGWYILVLE